MNYLSDLAVFTLQSIVVYVLIRFLLREVIGEWFRRKIESLKNFMPE